MISPGLMLYRQLGESGDLCCLEGVDAQLVDDVGRL